MKSMHIEQNCIIEKNTFEMFHTIATFLELMCIIIFQHEFDIKN
jgi:hypothetical protein